VAAMMVLLMEIKKNKVQPSRHDVQTKFNENLLVKKLLGSGKQHEHNGSMSLSFFKIIKC
jgi:hypothetical protein